MNKKGIIGLLVLTGILITLGFFLFIKEYEKGIPETANPASNYCITQGHRLEIREGENGQVGYCISSDGQECEEWDFYRKECSFKIEKKCVPASCCHASSCVLENEAPDCEEVFCTMECRGGTIDCEAGYCGFINGKCEVIWNE
jgi:hypothetical protein